MKLKDGLKNYSKGMIFDSYTKIVDEWKDYEKITKPKMLEEIIKELNKPENIISICTEKELKLLSKIISKKEFDDKRYKWELNELWGKCILIDSTIEITEELEESVKKALKIVNWEEVKENDRINEMSIGFVKSQGEVVLYALVSLISSLLQIDDKKIFDFYQENKLFKYYTYEEDLYLESMNSNVPVVIYNEYWEIVEDLRDQRKKYGASTIPNFNPDDFPSIFYNDLNINNPKVKQLVDVINKKTILADLMIKRIAESALLYKEPSIISNIFLNICKIEEKEYDKYRNILNEAIDEIPSGALNGCTPKAYLQLINDTKKYEEEKQIFNETQVNACLHPKDADLFYKLYFGLLDYTNQKYNANPNLSKIYKAKHLNPSELNIVIEKLWENKEITKATIDEFIKINPYRFNKYELSIVEDFKKGLRDHFMIVKYEEEYTQVLADGKTYMIKGVRDNFDNIISPSNLPIFVETTLLPFKNYIIYDGILSTYSVKIGLNSSKDIHDEAQHNTKYYHL